MKNELILNSHNYKIKNEVWSAITHGIGLIIAIIEFIFLINKTINTNIITFFSYITFGISLIILYFFSMIYHCLSFTKSKHIFQIFDHISIFILIGGSYTPFCLTIIGGQKGNYLFLIIWILCIIGIIYKIFWLGKFKKIETILYIILGWTSLIVIKPIWHVIQTKGVIFLLLGGITYTLGTLIYANKNILYSHVIWHIFVLIGSSFIFMSLYSSI